MSEIWSARCQECGGHVLICSDQNCSKWPCGRGADAKECSELCPTCKGAKEVVLVVECECKSSCLHECFDPDCNYCKFCSKCNRCEHGMHPLTVSEVEELVLITESYEGHATQVSRDWIKYHGVGKLIENYLQSKSNPMTQLTFKGQPVQIAPKEAA